MRSPNPDPTADLSTRRASLSGAQQARLAERLRGAVPAPAVPRIPALGLDEAPLSPAQQRQWFLWQLDPHSTAAHIGEAWELRGELDLPALTQALALLVERHPALRTVFVTAADGSARQRILRAGRLDLPVLDHSGRAWDDPLVQAEVQGVLQSPYEPGGGSAGSLLRTALVRLGPRSHVLLLGMHHIVSDGWSMQLLLRELGTAYAAAAQDRSCMLPALPIAPADHAVWQAAWWAGAERDRQLAYWREALGEEAPLLALPADHARVAADDAAAPQAHLSRELPAACAQALREQARAQGGTLFMSLLTGLLALLWRYTGQEDIRIGVPVSGRQQPETEGLVGLFVNTQVLRGRPQARLRLSELWAQVREAALGAQAHPDLPFEQLVEALQPQRLPGVHPLCQVMFNHLRDEAGSVAVDWHGLQPRRLPLALERPALFELAVTAVEDGQGGVQLDFGYPRSRFEPATIARLADHAVAVLQALADTPSHRLGELPLPHPQDAAFAAHACHPRRFASLPPAQALVAAQARARPEAIALLGGGQTLSYAELEAQANRLAHRLRQQGVQRETRVGVVLSRTLRLPVALLAVWKAGGAYVPLDPQWPAERLALMAQDAGLALLLTDAPLALPGSVPQLALAGLDLSQGPAEPPPGADAVHGEQLAYVLYTSGSTGQPKGVMVRHAALSNFLLSMRDEAPGLSEHDVVMATTALSFDIAGLEIHGGLVSGAQVVLVEQDTLRDARALAARIEAHRATVVQATPSGWRLLLAAGWRPARRVKALCGGEALAPDLSASLQALGVSLWNLYGPTETTIWSSAETVQGEGPPGMGRAIAGTQLHVLDAALQPVPLGAVGELCIGGLGLARGYLGRPGLSAERFVADPFSSAPGARLYRTGDQVRATAQGQLRYQGRADDQVKLRGFRIELGEIEAQLLAQPGVRAAVVMARPGPAGLRLVAYLAHAGEALDTAGLREALARQLPEYMLPAAWVPLPALPLNTSGKVDRKALPDPAIDAEPWSPPEGPTEQALAALWQSLLGAPRIGRRDHFFDLGGHSLLAMQLIARLQDQGHPEAELKDLFRWPRLQELAAHLDARRASAPAPGASQAQALAEMDAFFDSLG